MTPALAHATAAMQRHSKRKSPSTGDTEQPLLSATLHHVNEACPFSNDKVHIQLSEGECLWLKGPSGVGKSLSCLQLLAIQDIAGIDTEVNWRSDVPVSQRAGMLFQQGVLVDSLSVYENIKLSLETTSPQPSTQHQVKELLELVGLDIARDGPKYPNELSGGMLRRATLAQLLAQNKKLIVLDEPFVGLDHDAATVIVEEIQGLIQSKRAAFILISHQPEFATQLANVPDVALLSKPTPKVASVSLRHDGATLAYRTRMQLYDYLVYSIPLVVLALIAAGFAMSMLSAQLLVSVDVKRLVNNIIETEFLAKAEGFMAALAKTLTMKVNRLLDVYVPDLMETMYTTGMAKLFVLEIGPLLTALLMTGRIGGSYAGNVATMVATNQCRLLRNIGVNPIKWTLEPAVISALVAAPILSAIASFVALITASICGVWYEIVEFDVFWSSVGRTVFELNENTALLVYPPFVLLYRSLGFIVAIMVVAEVVARWNDLLQPRDVSSVITMTVVVSGLLVISLDYGFSQVRPQPS
eukprot:m.124969 g.124969  ORF g.124969 m.124969 type:complete len:527 (-) comp13792_c1_seq1:627-2207(-)